MVSHPKGTLEKLELVPNPEEGCCFNRGVSDMQCTVTVYVDDLLVTWKDEATMAGVIEALKAKYHPMFISDVLKDIELMRLA